LIFLCELGVLCGEIYRDFRFRKYSEKYANPTMIMARPTMYGMCMRPVNIRVMITATTPPMIALIIKIWN
jgi:hypothetical protein